MRSQRVEHDWATFTCLLASILIPRQPESHNCSTRRNKGPASPARNRGVIPVAELPLGTADVFHWGCVGKLAGGFLTPGPPGKARYRTLTTVCLGMDFSGSAMCVVHSESWIYFLTPFENFQPLFLWKLVRLTFFVLFFWDYRDMNIRSLVMVSTVS